MIAEDNATVGCYSKMLQFNIQVKCFIQPMIYDVQRFRYTLHGPYPLLLDDVPIALEVAAV